MSRSRNKLLTTLSVLGMAASVSTLPATAQAQSSYGSFGEFFGHVTASVRGDMKSKLAFVQAYPMSPVATRMVQEIAEEIASMSPADRQAAINEIADLGGIPSGVADIAGSALSESEIAEAFESMTTASTSTPGSTGAGTSGSSIY